MNILAGKGRRHYARGVIALILLLVIVYSILSYLRPLPALTPYSTAQSIPSSTVNLNWPAGTEAAVGAEGYGVLSTYGDQTPKPTASVAKIITALTILKKYPLGVNQTSMPLITLGPADVALYNQYAAEQGSVVMVSAGEQISEYQAIEAMLLPSANNMADSLANWAYGSLQAYSAAAAQEVAGLGLSSTHVGSDASGFLPGTTASAHDLVLLGQAALQNPVISAIVAQKQVTLPVAGIVKNVNYLLGSDGIIGIKTGNTDQAGGVYLFAAQDNLGSGYNVTVLGAVMGTVNLATALSDSLPLLTSAESNFSLRTLASRGQTVAQYNLPWGNHLNAVAAKTLTAVVWKGSPINLVSSLHAIYAPLPEATNVGTISLNGDTNSYSDVILQSQVPSPPWWWRIIRHKL